MLNTKARLIAHYLPQFHPIPENDEWWGKGFTEWTNVAKAIPLFKGHYQPHLPADLGYYDLRVPEVREAQAELAKKAGIEGFCYWHYWFAGKRILERPINEVLSSGKPDFPFCFGWGNQTWSGIWHGLSDKILIEQTYPGIDDHIAHFNALLPAFKDKRYIRVDDKPLFLVYRPKELPDSLEFIKLWRDLAISAGLKGLHIVGVVDNVEEGLIFHRLGFDASTISNLDWNRNEPFSRLLNPLFRRFGRRRVIYYYQKLFKRPFHVFKYTDVCPPMDIEKDYGFEWYPRLVPNWDNTPRSGLNGYVIKDASPDLFRSQVRDAIKIVERYDLQHRIIFIKSWNEWAEGNYLEPDQKFGSRFLDAIANEILKSQPAED